MPLCRHVVLSLAAAVGLACSAAAQPFDWHRFYPLGAGDTWVYESCNTIDPGPCEDVEFMRRTVVGDTVIDGLEYARVEETFGLGGSPALECFERLTEEGQIAWLGPVGCRPPGALDLDLRGGDAEAYPLGEFVIGGQAYEPDSVLFFYDWISGPYVHNATFASDIGFVGDWYDFMGPGDTGYVSLRYAEVGGATYGVLPVASEGDTAPTAFSLGPAFPNPLRSTATLTLSLATAEAVMIEAFDVLGRRVLRRDLGVQPAGAVRHTIDLGAAPSGVYFVRVTTASGESATRRVVRVD